MIKDKIDLKKLSLLDEESSIKYRINIINNNDLIDIPSAILPDVFSSDYFFISYSHKDYKSVYKDIFYLEKLGLNIWYDRGIPAGKNWKDIANKYLTPFSCVGVIFYISENSLLSDAVLEELEYAKKVNKQIITINLPFESDYVYKEENVKGKIYSIREMIDILLLNNKEINKETANRLKEIFPEEIIYIPYNMDDSQKVEKIKGSIKRQPLLNGHFDYESSSDAVLLCIDSINDTFVNKITEEDILNLTKDIKTNENILSDADKEWSEYYRLVFSSCCLSNCFFLEEVIIPSWLIIYNIGDNAFYNDKNLRIIKNSFIECEIGKEAFKGCSSLEEIVVGKSINHIGESAFDNCSSLKAVKVEKKSLSNPIVLFDDKEASTLRGLNINKKAFNNCSLLEIFEPFDLAAVIQSEAFNNCHSLKSISFGKYTSKIEYNAFQGCLNLKEININKENNCFLLEDNVLYEINNKQKKKILLFLNKEAISHLFIDESIEEISPFILRDRSKNLSFEVDKNNQKYASFNGGLYSKDYEELLFYPNGLNYKLELHPSTKRICSYAFSHSDYQIISVPYQIEEMDDYAFYNVKNLEALLIYPHNLKASKRTQFITISELFNYAHTVLYLKNRSDNDHKYRIDCFDSPHDVVYNIDEDYEPIIVDNYQYLNVDKDKMMIISYHGSDRRTIMIPDQVTYKGKTYNIDKIGKSAFANIKSLEKISFKGNITTLCHESFSGLRIKEIIFPDSLIKIESGSFFFCSQLKKISLPLSLNQIDEDAFLYCDNLKTIIFRGTIEELKTKSYLNALPKGIMIECIDGNYLLETKK